MPRTRQAPAPPSGYASRDAQAAAAPTGMPYGQHSASVAAQKAVPLPNVSAPAAAAAPAPAPKMDMTAALATAAAHAPPTGGFSAPTQRPNEPLTAGAPSGPGPGPAPVANIPNDNLSATLRGIYLRYPTEDLRNLIAELDTGVY